MIKNKTILTLLLLFGFIGTFMAALALAIESILGYTGFQRFNYQSYDVTLKDGCQNAFFMNKYGEARDIRIQIVYISTVSASFFGLLILFIVIGMMCNERKKKRLRREQTTVEHQGSASLKKTNFIELDYPSSAQVNALYIFDSGANISSLVPFKFYLQLWLDSYNQVCPIKINQIEVGALAIINGLILFFFLTGLFLTLFMVHRVHRRDEELKLQKRSVDFHEQMQKIIEEIPSSERRFYRKGQPNLSPVSNEGGESKSSDHELSSVKRVQSILYSSPDSLRLQSVVVSKR